MSSVGDYLLSKIHDRATAKLVGVEWSSKDYSPVINAWFEAAEEMVKEFETEGLYATAEALKKEIAWQRKYVNV